MAANLLFASPALRWIHHLKAFTKIRNSMKQSITEKFATDAIAAPAAVTGGCGKGGKSGKSGGKSKSKGKGRSRSKSGSGKSGSRKSGCGGVVGDQFT